MTLITRRGRIRHHLGDAVARYVEMLCSLTSAHSFRTSQTNLQIKFHGIDPQPSCSRRRRLNRWPTFTPPEAGQSRRYRGLILHRRSQRNRPQEPKNPWCCLAHQQRDNVIGIGSGGQHQGQRSYRAASIGRRHNCTRPAKLNIRQNHIAKRAPMVWTPPAIGRSILVCTTDKKEECHVSCSDWSRSCKIRV